MSTSLKNTRPVHDLREISKAIVRKESSDGRGIKPGTGGLEFCRGNATRDPEMDRDAGTSRFFEHELKAFFTEHVGDLVGIADRCHGAVPHRDASKFRRGKHAALDVDMGIDETREQVARVDRLVVAEGADRLDQPILNLDLRWKDLSVMNIDDLMTQNGHE